MRHQNGYRLAVGSCCAVKPRDAGLPAGEVLAQLPPTAGSKIVARDASKTGWFAFKAPREVGRLSFWAVRVLGAAEYLLFAGLGLLLLNLAMLLNPKRSAPAVTTT